MFVIYDKDWEIIDIANSKIEAISIVSNHDKSHYQFEEEGGLYDFSDALQDGVQEFEELGYFFEEYDSDYPSISR